MPSTSFELTSQVVKAGAGTGKTTNLTQTIIEKANEFYNSQGRLPHFIVTTFTRKATEELRERITSQVFRSENMALHGLVQSKQYLQISTIHGVLSLFLRQYGPLMGLEAGFQVSDETASNRLGKKTLLELVPGSEAAQELLKYYSFDQILNFLEARRKITLSKPKSTFYNVEDLQKSYKSFLNPIFIQLSDSLKEIISESSSEKWERVCHFFSFRDQSRYRRNRSLENSRKLKSLGKKTLIYKQKACVFIRAF